MIELRVDLADGASVANALRVLSFFATGAPAANVVAANVVIAEARQPKAEAKAEPKPKKEEPKPAPKEDDLLGDSAPEAPVVTRDDCAKAIMELSKKKGRPAAVAVLEMFRPDGLPKTVKNSDGEDVPNEVKLPLVAKENYGKLVAEAKKALAA